MISVLPAYAGMILRIRRREVGTIRAPRVCGDDPFATRTLMVEQGCSPRMRG